ncbi:ROK family transcriptional regulator [Dactylosporangium sp. AC04546]|uniref:ROK family transcriptional regulator n=1 Tax=Dactylosporangium sp. AC04546 TaxID=2862460 RepID=UPI001EDF1E64|nr:ROK family transcriptional regulator [Dactylosporangium sp. AC04546]WVK80915.1 ROK family transcriptional regulator [Dactylosporangium sp. AC04546]
MPQSASAPRAPVHHGAAVTGGFTGPGSGAPGAGELLQLLRDGQPRTRAELARLTGLARSTVSLRVDALLASGLLAPSGEAASTGGRPPARFAFNPRARVVVGVDLGATHGHVALTDLTGQPLSEVEERIEISAGPTTVLDWVVATTRRLLDEADRDVKDLVGIGIGLPGPVEHSSGRPMRPPIMPGWDGYDVPGHVRHHWDVPVLVDNDVNIMALGEHVTAHPELDHLLFVKVATGIGAGIISGRRLLRGAVGAAGDLGHVAAPHAPDVLCKCGNTGCLEAVASGHAIIKHLTTAGVPATTNSDVVALVRGGNITAAHAVRQAGRTIGEVLATCVSLLNPQLVVIGGSLAQAGESLIAGVREVVYGRSLPLATAHLQIVPATTGTHAGVIGAATMAIQHALAAERIDEALAKASSPPIAAGA